jgi:hypothetical protein
MRIASFKLGRSFPSGWFIQEQVGNAGKPGLALAK